MKKIITPLMILALLLSCVVLTQAQPVVTHTARLELGKIESYQVQVTYNKTSNLIFPSAIRRVDLGSDYLIGDKAEEISNVLYLKASVRDFTEETNFSVITDDGGFYSFNVTYSPDPAITNYDLLTMQKKQSRQQGNDVLFQELGSIPPSLAGLLMTTIYKKDKRLIRHIGARSYGIRFLLKGIYIHDGKYYFHSEIRNKSNVPFCIDFVNFKVVDKKVAKRTVVQQRLLTPLRIYKPLDAVAGNNKEQNVFLLDQFTLSDDKVLLIELYEKNGGRHQVLQVENADLVHARVIKDMHLKIH